MATITLLTLAKKTAYYEILRLFEDTGWDIEIESVNTVKAAAHAISTKKIDVIISPIDLPDFNIFEFIRWIKGQSSFPPFIITFGESPLAEEIEAYNKGVDFYYDSVGQKEPQSLRLRSFINQITIKREIEMNLSFSLRNMETVVDSTEDSIYIVDRHVRYLFINSPHRKRLFITDPIIEGHLYKDYHLPDETEKFTSIVNNVFKTGKAEIEEYRKKERWFQRKFIPVVYETSKDALAIIVISSDITILKQLMEKAEGITSLLTSALSSTSDGLLILDRANQIIRYNENFITFWNIPEQLTKSNDYSMIANHILTALLHPSLYTKIIKEQNSSPAQEFFELLELLDGRTFELHAFPHLLGNTVVGFIHSYRDITERKQATIALRWSEANYRTLVESVDGPIYMVNENCSYLFMNRLHMALLGVIGENYQPGLLDVFLPPEEMKWFKRVIKTIYETKKSIEDEFKWGETFYIRKFCPVHDDESSLVRAVTVIMTDITDRKKGEALLKSSEERLKILFEYAPEAYYLTDTKGTFIDLNRATEALTLYKKDELLGKIFFNFKLLSKNHVKKAAILLAKNALGLATGPDEMVIKRKNGEDVIVEVMTYPVIIGPDHLVLNIARDITERKRAQDAIMQINKKLNLLSSITRHDVLNQVMTVLGSLELSKELIHDELLQRYYKMAEDATYSIRQHISFTKAYEEIGVKAPQWQNVFTLFTETAEHAGESQTTLVDPELISVWIYADPLLPKVFYNLFDNTRKHGGDLDEITIFSEETRDGILVIYTDNGSGVSYVEKEKIFERGFGKNTGFGMFLAREILSMTRITIQEKGIPEHGVRFEMFVPRGGYRILEPDHEFNTLETGESLLLPD